MGPGIHGTGFRGRLTQAEAKVPQHNTGPGTHVTRIWGRLTPAQAEAGGRKEGRKEGGGGRMEIKEKTEPQSGGEEKPPKNN